MSSPFTAGPWEVSADGVWAKSPWNARVKIATVTICAPMNGIDWQANARLIAAAPDMLDALEGISRNAALDDAWLKPVFAAIAKAKGKSLPSERTEHAAQHVSQANREG